MFVAYIQEMACLNNNVEIFCGFPRSRQANARIIPHMPPSLNKPMTVSLNHLMLYNLTYCEHHYICAHKFCHWLVIYSYVSQDQTTVNNSQGCNYTCGKNDENAVRDVDINSWGDCKPNGTSVPNVCMFFKINKVFFFYLVGWDLTPIRSLCR
jgi:hypothetical protein